MVPGNYIILAKKGKFHYTGGPDISLMPTSKWNEMSGSASARSKEFPSVSLHLAARLEISTPGKNGALCVVAELGS